MNESRQKAIAAVRAQLGLNDYPSSWSYDQRVSYNKALAAYILQNPVGFTAADTNTAATTVNKSYADLEDDSFDWAMFGREVQDNAGGIAKSFVADVSKAAAVALVVWLVFQVFKLKRYMK